MKQIVHFIIFVVLLCTNAFAKEFIIFAPLPMQNKASLIQQFSPMLEYLQRETEQKYKIDYYKDYKSLLDKFIQGKIDLLYLGPLPVVDLQKHYKEAKPLVFFKDEDGSEFYTCSLIALMDTEIDFTHPIKNKKIALTQPLSTCGYLSVNHILSYTKSSLEQNNYAYIGGHDTVALHVAQKKALLGGVKTTIAKKYYGIGIDILSTTEPMPMFALVGNAKTLSKTTLEKIQTALLLAKKKEYSNWGKNISHGTTKASNEAYSFVKKLQKKIKIPLIRETLFHEDFK